jgi:hypothetical protein
MQYLRKFASHKEYMEAFASIGSEEDRLRFKKAVCIFDDNCGSDTTKKPLLSIQYVHQMRGLVT